MSKTIRYYKWYTKLLNRLKWKRLHLGVSKCNILKILTESSTRKTINIQTLFFVQRPWAKDWLPLQRAIYGVLFDALFNALETNRSKPKKVYVEWDPMLTRFPCVWIKHCAMFYVRKICPILTLVKEVPNLYYVY